MSSLRPHLFWPLPFLLPRLYPRLPIQGLHSSIPSSHISAAGLKSPNPALDLDPALQALLKDTDMSILRAKNRHMAAGASVDSLLYRHPHRELEVINMDVEDVEIPEADIAQVDPFPRSERKSPAASFGSRGIGAVVLPFELQQSNKSLVHADATRLFQEQNDSEEAWSTRYTSPSYTVPRSTSKMAHIKARLNRQRDGTAFASVVMPAQYAVVVAVLAAVKTRLGAEWAKGVDRVVEWGSGTGAGMWAALHAFRQPSDPEGDQAGEISLAWSKIAAYVGIDQRDGLTAIARRLLRDIPFQRTSISLQKSLHSSDRVRRTEGLGTIALSAFNLSTLANVGLRRQMVREMWDSGADVIVVIDEASEEGFRHVADAREYLLKLGQREVDAVARERLASATSLSQGESLEIPGQDLDDRRGRRGSHVIAPCPHDHPCPLALHVSPPAAKSPAVQSAASSVRCTFSQRLQRPAFVRKTKHAGKGEEDVGYSYIVVRRGERPVRDVVDHVTRAGRVGAVGRWADEALRAKAHEAEEQAREATWAHGNILRDAARVRVRGAPVHEQGEALQEILRVQSYDWPRINFPPLKRSGHVLIDACMPEGNIMRLTIPRSQGKQIYYDARKSNWGDLFPHQPKHRPVLRYTGPKTKSIAPMSVPKDAADEDGINAVEGDRQFERALGLNEARITMVGKAEGRRRGTGGEGALKVGVKSAGRAGWGGVVEVLKEEDRKRRRERRQKRGSKDAVEV